MSLGAQSDESINPHTSTQVAEQAETDLMLEIQQNEQERLNRLFSSNSVPQNDRRTDSNAGSTMSFATPAKQSV